jgi:hypothetical protein
MLTVFSVPNHKHGHLLARAQVNPVIAYGPPVR